MYEIFSSCAGHFLHTSNCPLWESINFPKRGVFHVGLCFFFFFFFLEGGIVGIILFVAEL